MATHEPSSGRREPECPSKSTRLSAVALMSGMLFAGCSETGVTPNTDFRDVTCPSMACDKTFTLDTEELDTLRGCYLATDFTPPDEIQACFDLNDDCVITVMEGFEAAMQDRACCVDEFPNYPDQEPPDQCEIEGEPESVDICTPPTEITYGDWRFAGDELVAALQNDCDFELVADPPVCTATGEARGWGGVCTKPDD